MKRGDIESAFDAEVLPLVALLKLAGVSRREACASVSSLLVREWWTPRDTALRTLKLDTSSDATARRRAHLDAMTLRAAQQYRAGTLGVDVLRNAIALRRPPDDAEPREPLAKRGGRLPSPLTPAESATLLAAIEASEDLRRTLGTYTRPDGTVGTTPYDQTGPTAKGGALEVKRAELAKRADTELRELVDGLSPRELLALAHAVIDMDQVIDMD